MKRNESIGCRMLDETRGTGSIRLSAVVSAENLALITILILIGARINLGPETIQYLFSAGLNGMLL